jgi:hypothetical protein
MTGITNVDGVTTVTDRIGTAFQDSGNRGRGPWSFSIWQPVEHPYSATMRVWDHGEVTIERHGRPIETYASMAEVIGE